MTDCVSGVEISDGDIIALLALLVVNDPITFNIDAVMDTKWKKAMNAKIKAIENNETCELTNHLVEEKTIGIKWIYKTKLKEKGRSG